MKYLLLILSTSILLSGELEVDGNLTVADTLHVTTIQSATIDSLLSLIAQLEMRIAQLECQNTGIIPEGYCDCFFHTLDECGVCNGDTTSCQDCAGVVNGDSLQDMCGYCDNDSSNDCVQDCNGEWGGTAVEDACGECGGDAEIGDECYSIYDYDGNSYTAVQIGNQVWLAENLKVDHYRNGDPINFVDSSSDWAIESQGNYSYYNYSESLKSIYGNLYNWYAVVDSRNICPDNYRVPQNIDLFQLIDYLGGNRNTAGSKLKETGYDHWNEPNTGASDEYGFRAIPGGKIEPDGLSYLLGENATFWTTSVAGHNPDVVHMEQLYHDNEQLNSYWVSKMNGYSVRCIQE